MEITFDPVKDKANQSKHGVTQRNSHMHIISLRKASRREVQSYVEQT